MHAIVGLTSGHRTNGHKEHGKEAGTNSGGCCRDGIANRSKEHQNDDVQRPVSSLSRCPCCADGNKERYELRGLDIDVSPVLFFFFIIRTEENTNPGGCCQPQRDYGPVT